MVSKRPTRKANVRLLSPEPRETAAQRIVRVTETFYETAGTVALADQVNDQQAKASPFSSSFGNAAYGNGYGQPSGRPIPDIPPVSPTKPPMLDYGATGTSFFSGLLQNDEYNPEFYWRDAILKYEQMRRNDPQIIAQEMMLTLPILAAKWSIEPASEDPKDVEIASFVETCLLQGMDYTSRSGVVVHQTFHDILKHALLLFAYGFTAFELCFKIEDGWVKWSRWLPLLPRTVWRWWVDEDNELVGIQQWSYRDYSYRFVDIPAGKLLTLAHRQEGQNYEGVSVLRTAFKPWWFKQNFEKILAVAIERTGIEVPVITVGPTPSDSDVKAALTILQNVRANEYMGAVIPHDWQFGYPKLYANHAEAILPALQYMDTMIARNVLCQFLDLGSTETGAYNLDASQKQTFLMSLQATCEYLASRFQGPIQQLVDYNFDDVATYPKVTCSKLVSQDMVTLGQVLQQIPGYIPATPQIQDFLTDMVGLPSAPRNPVEATNPTDPKTPERPDDVSGNAASKDHTTQQAGVGHSNPSGTGAGGQADMDVSGEDDQADNTEAAVAGQMSNRALTPVDTRLLNEALAAIYGRDATERGARHLAEVAR